MGKALALDFGLKRTGIAISDETQTFSFAKETVDSRELMTYLEKIVVTEKVDTIVLGEPKRLNNEPTNITQNVHLLFEALQKKFPSLHCVLIDERFTSKMAALSLAQLGHSKAVRQNKGLIDEVSAAIILQSYLANK
jgi:putative holliday junction resolvase